MKKKIFILGLFVLTVGSAYSQGDVNISDTSLRKSEPYLSILNLKPLLIKKGEMMFNFGLEFPNYYKVYNGLTKKVEKISPKIVQNETSFYGHFTYGLSDRINLFTVVPYKNIHHYSPMMFQKGIGFGDIQLGGNYQLINSQTKENTNYLSANIKITLPTGKYDNLKATDYPTGIGAYRFTFSLDGMFAFGKSNFVYSGYYEYRANHDGLDVGDKTGLFLTMQRPYYTKFGAFGIEYGSYFYYNFKNTKSGVDIPNTKDYSVNAYAGAWYKYLDRYYIRFGVPYSIYQNDAFMTKYEVLLQFDYVLK